MINTVTLIGRLTKDPELRQTQGNTSVLSFTLAVGRNFKNQDGSVDADFINCVIWRKPAEILAQYTRKGSQIAVRGRLQSRSYEDKTGHRVYVTEVVCDDFQLLDSRRQETMPNQGMDAAFGARPATETPAYQAPMDTNPYGTSVSSFADPAAMPGMGATPNVDQPTNVGTDFNTTSDIADEDLPF